MTAINIVERLRAPKAWMAWNDYGKVTLTGDPIPPMDHDSDVPRLAADEIVNLRREIVGLTGETHVLADILRDANEVIKTIEPENSDEEERLWQLRYMIEMAISPYNGARLSNETNVTADTLNASV